MPERSLADALFTATQQRVFSLLFGQPERSFFVTEIIDLAGVGRHYLRVCRKENGYCNE